MAEATRSISELFKKNPRLKKNFDKSKTIVARKDYSGEPGDVTCTFNGKTVVTIDNNDCIILEFRVDGGVAGQEDHNGERIAIFNKFMDDDYGTVESRQDQFHEQCQLMGIGTKALAAPDGLDKAMDEIRKSGQQFVIKVVKKPGKGKNAGKTFTNYFIQGVAEEGQSTETVNVNVGDADETSAEEMDTAIPPTVEEYGEAADNEDEDAANQLRRMATEAGLDPEDGDTYHSWSALAGAIREVWNSTPDAEADAEAEEWNEEEAAAESEPEPETHADYAPSDWKEFTVQYKPKNAPKALEFKVIDANDKNGTMSLERNNKVLTGVKYLDVILP